MPNYQNGKIYKLVSPSGKTYIGSTTQSLAVRKAEHKSKSIKYANNGKVNYCHSFKLFEEDDENYKTEIILIENFPCDSKEELHQRERHHIDINECVNKQKPMRTKEQHRREHRDELLRYNKKYHLENKKDIKERKHNKRLANIEKIKEKRLCDCGGTFTGENKYNHMHTQKHLMYVKSSDYIPVKSLF